MWRNIGLGIHNLSSHRQLYCLLSMQRLQTLPHLIPLISSKVHNYNALSPRIAHNTHRDAERQRSDDASSVINAVVDDNAHKILMQSFPVRKVQNCELNYSIICS